MNGETMDSCDYVSLTESAAAERSADAGAPFGPRLRRAVLLLAAAISMHIWVVRAPQPGRPVLLPDGPALLQSGLGGSGAAASAAGLVGSFVSSRANRPVQVKTELISISSPANPGASARPLPTPELPVGTSGYLRARADLPAAAQGDASLSEQTEPSPVLVSAVASLPSGPEMVPTRTAVADTVAPALEKPEKWERAPAAPVLEPRERAITPANDSAFAAAPATVTDRAADLRKQEEIVRKVLGDYARAFERLDVQAAKAIWPSLDDRALQRAFQQLDGQELRFASCGVSVSGHDANARCRGDATYRPKVGSRVLRLTAREWTFNLSRDNDRWQIVNATLQ